MLFFACLRLSSNLYFKKNVHRICSSCALDNGAPFSYRNSKNGDPELLKFKKFTWARGGAKFEVYLSKIVVPLWDSQFQNFEFCGMDFEFVASAYIVWTKMFSFSCSFCAGGKGTKQLVDRCIAYIGENAVECFKTNSFLNLNKEAVIKILSSDCVSIEYVKSFQTAYCTLCIVSRAPSHKILYKFFVDYNIIIVCRDRAKNKSSMPLGNDSCSDRVTAYSLYYTSIEKKKISLKMLIFFFSMLV